ncbi:MAG: hydrolase [Alphaproteobacteria bacterium]|nr:hydrolase [Alphaproteobacteria bacterium]
MASRRRHGGEQLDLLEKPDARTVLITRSGIAIDLTKPDFSALPVEDLARALAYQPRWNGATTAFYSVAEHSVMASHLVPEAMAYDALMHDAEEALTGDMPTPIKNFLGRENLSKRLKPLKKALAKRFGFRLDLAAVKHADLVCMATEIRDLLPAHWVEWPNLPDPAPDRIVPVGPEDAMTLFLARYEALRPKRD